MFIMRTYFSSLVLLVLSGCSNTSFSPAYPGVDSDILTPDVVALLDGNGHFPRSAITSQPFTQINYRDAERYADAFVRTFGAISEQDWSSVHGAPVDSRDLRRCGPTLYATSAYELAGVLEWIPLRNFIAGHFIVQYCTSNGTPQVLVSLTEAESDLRLIEGGFIEIPLVESTAHAIEAHGIRQDVLGYPIIAPERAAELVSERTGSRISGIPKLIRAPFPLSAMYSRWLIPLENPITVFPTGSEAGISVSEVYVGLEYGENAPARVLVPGDNAGEDTFVDMIPAPSSEGDETILIPVVRLLVMPRNTMPLI